MCSEFLKLNNTQQQSDSKMDKGLEGTFLQKSYINGQ
jgi:hypothetical protein